MSRKATGSGAWNYEATRALLNIWGEQNVQEQLDGVAKNRCVYEKVSKEMHELGYEKTWAQCRTKIKNLLARYRKVKDGNRITGRGRCVCPFYDEIDSIVGTRAASEPPILLDSGDPGSGVPNSDEGIDK